MTYMEISCHLHCPLKPVVYLLSWIQMTVSCLQNHLLFIILLVFQMVASVLIEMPFTHKLFMKICFGEHEITHHYVILFNSKREQPKGHSNGNNVRR